jgi:hypothetical protein
LCWEAQGTGEMEGAYFPRLGRGTARSAPNSGLIIPGSQVWLEHRVFDGLIAAGIVAGVYLLTWFSYLIFLCWLVRHTNDPKVLRDAAVAAKAFPGAGFAVAIARLVRPR